MMDRIQQIREEEFFKMDYNFEGFIMNKPNQRDYNPLTREIKACQLKILQKALQLKNKPGYRDKEFETTDNRLELLKEDDIQIEFIEEEKEKKKDFDFNSFPIEEKMNYIREYMDRKYIKLNEDQYKDIQKLLENTEFNWRLYITISKLKQNISKVNFLQKNELGDYIVSLKSNKKEKKFFI